MNRHVPALAPTAPLPAHGPPVASVRFKTVAEDFQVEELPLVTPNGQGEHVLLEIRKRDLSTLEAARRLADHLDVPPRLISHAGLKDRAAITTQWLSVHDPGGSRVPPAGPVAEGVEILQAGRHSRKLKIGTLAGNRFRIRLRGIDGQHAAVDSRLLDIARHGVANYFGSQRFGRNSTNLDQALAWHRGKRRVSGRNRQGLLLSALRSEVFNRVLRYRVGAGSWNRAVTGDQMILDGRGSIFPADDAPPARLARRLALQSIHPTGLLPGVGGPQLSGQARALECEVLDGVPEFVALLARRGVAAQRRALRVRVRELAWQWLAADELVLIFHLPPGAYATTVLAECFLIE